MTIATAEAPATDLVDRPVHLARCAVCGDAVKYQPSASGAGFVLVEADPDAVYGVGEEGRPVCQFGHGEMAIADDRFPAAEAFALAQAQVEAAFGPAQGTLPGVFPPFNFEGAYLELEGQAMRVEALRKTYEDDATTAKESKKAWDKAEELYTRMALQFRERRRAKPDEAVAVTAEPRLVRCTWEAAHEGEDCPMCTGETARTVLVDVLGPTDGWAAPDAVAHLEDVERLQVGIEVALVVESLEAVGTHIDLGLIQGWSPEERQAVVVWASALFDTTHNAIAVDPMPARPTVLGKPHIPALVDADGRQVCSFCESVLVKSSTYGAVYLVTDYVGVDCPGKPAEATHRYPPPATKRTRAKKDADA